MSLAQTHHDRFSTVGNEILVLFNHYDDRQYWFDFVKAVYPNNYIEKKCGCYNPKPPSKNNKVRYRTRIPTTNDPQYCLRYRENIKLTASMRKRWSGNEFPTFDRDSNGKIYSLHVAEFSRAKGNRMEKWLTEHCSSFFNISGSGQVIFEKKEDHFLALISGQFDFENNYG